MKLLSAPKFAALVLNSDPNQNVLANELSGKRLVEPLSAVFKVSKVLHS